MLVVSLGVSLAIEMRSAHSLQPASSVVLCGGPTEATFSLMLPSSFRNIKWRLHSFTAFPFLEVFFFNTRFNVLFIFCIYRILSFHFLHVSDFSA